MPNPASLTASAVDIPDAELHEAVVLDSASALGEEIRCTIPSFSERYFTEPMPWSPYVTPAGFFYPKKDDRAVLGYPVDGPPVILEWWPNAAEPDQTFG
jgi:hypothetical protein